MPVGVFSRLTILKPLVVGLVFLMMELARASSPCWAQEANQPLPDKLVAEGEGEAGIVNQDVTGARKEALDLALANAFQRALPSALPAGLSLAKQEELIRDLAPMQKDCLLQFRITSELPALQTYFVTVEAAFAGAQIQEELVRRGIVQQRERGGEPVPVDLKLKGITSLRLYQEFVTRLAQQVDRVQSVQPLEVHGTQAVLRVLYRGNPRTFAEALDRWVSETFWPDQEARGESARPEISVSLPAPDGSVGNSPASARSSKP
jgi:hypothetical protein